MENSLKNKKSPYLLEHSNDPIDWIGWDDLLFDEVKKEKKPIMLSIGYSSCHWCHVMQKESFKNMQIAQKLNSSFISVKIDREEYPSLDKRFQEIYRLMNKRNGGWPLTIFLTHEGEPFFSATYLPPKTNKNMTGLYELLTYIEQNYEKDYANIKNVAKNVNEALVKQKNHNNKDDSDTDILKKFTDDFKNAVDRVDGGFGSSPKFPHASALICAIAVAASTNDDELASETKNTILKMSQGGFYDLVEGGFCRYSVDEWWLVPHFEKMCYDNALLAELYLRGYGYFRDERLLEIGFETLDFMSGSMLKDGLFISAIDADSEGEEGKYYVFDTDEIKKAETDKEAELFELPRFGNFEKKTILRLKSPDTAKANYQNLTHNLQKIRQTRVFPHIDFKAITALNGMAAKTFILAGLIKEGYGKIGESVLDTLLLNHYDGEFLYRYSANGERSPIKGYLEDYAYLADALLESYAATFDNKRLDEAERIIQKALELFFEDGVWMCSDDEFRDEDEVFDNAYPSAAAVILSSIERLYVAERGEYLKYLKPTLYRYKQKIAGFPFYAPKMTATYLSAYDLKAEISTASPLQGEYALKYLANPFATIKQSECKTPIVCGCDMTCREL